MKEEDDGIPPWMIAQDILVKIKDELVLEAIDILHKEIDAKRIAITGSVGILPERSVEVENDLFVIRNMLESREAIHKQYETYLNAKPGDKMSKQEAVRVEDLRKLMMAISEISLLMEYGTAIEAWITDAGTLSKSKTPAEVIGKSVHPDQVRAEILAFVLKNKRFIAAEPLNDKENATLKEAQKISGG
jgi:hypothetical protein